MSPLLSLLLVLPAAGPGAQFFQPLSPPRHCQMMVARGQKYLVPENTAVAIEHAIDDLIEWIEVDVRRTKDGHHVLMHDPTVDRTTTGSGSIAGFTLDELRGLDAGGRFAPRFRGTKIPTLAEAFDLARQRIAVCLECQDVDPARLVDEIRAAGLQNQVVVSGAVELLRKVRERSAGDIALRLRWPGDSASASLIAELQPAVVEIDADRITPDLCRAWQASGIQVHAAAIGPLDQPKYWRQALSAGANGIKTDAPEEVVALELFDRVKQRPVRFALHRGASRYAPENTAPAFEKAFRLQADYVEFDVRTSADGVCFLLHDAGLDRTTNGTGPLSKHASAELLRLEAGSWFSHDFAEVTLPTLDDFLMLAKDRAQLYFDAKAISPDALAAALARHGLEDRTVVFQGPGYLEKLKAINPAIKRMPPLYRPEQLDRLVERLRPFALDVAWDSLSPDLIARCHRHGVRVFSDAKDDNTQGHLKAIGMGIDLIQTDHPMQLLRAIELHESANR